MTDDELKQWEQWDGDVGDALHRHFREASPLDWMEAGAEGRRVYNLMFQGDDDPVEEWSPIDGVLHAVAAQAIHGAFAAVGLALGFDADVIEMTVDDFYYQKRTDILGIEKFIERAAKNKQYLQDLHSGKLDKEIEAI